MESEGDESSHLRPNQSKCSSSSFEIPILPPELIAEILSRLPVKPLLKTRCVSKSWLALISSPQFINTHLNISSNKKDNAHRRLIMRLVLPAFNLRDCSLNSLFRDSVTESFKFDYLIKDSPKIVSVVGSIHGLVCFSVGLIDLFLWNPSIGKFKKLPDSGADCYFMSGFGYDEVHNDYKVVGICRNCNNLSHFLVKIYSVNGNSWTSIDGFRTDMLFIKSAGVFVNGKLHWALTTSQDLRYYNGWDIVSIDLANVKLGKVEKPCYGEGHFYFTASLGVLGSDLSMFCNNWRHHIDVWIMKEYGVKESWNKMLTINRPDDPMLYPFYPFFCMSNEGELLVELGSCFMIYNPKDDSVRFQLVIDCCGFSETIIYVESLLWPYSAEDTRDATATHGEKALTQTAV